MTKTKGSVTVFMALTMPVMFMALLVLIEAGRYVCLDSCSSMAADQAADGMKSYFNAKIYDQYNLMLFWEEDVVEGSLRSAERLQKEVIARNYEEEKTIFANTNMLRPALSEVTTMSYQLITDNEGNVFIKSAAKACCEQFEEKAVTEIADIIRMDQDNDSGQAVDDALENANKAIDKAKADKSAVSEDSNVDIDTTGITADNNPIEWVKQLRRQGVTALVLDADQISNKCLDTSQSLNVRKRKKGNMVRKVEVSYADRLMFHMYTAENFDNVTCRNQTSRNGKALDYELEYILAGKKTDSENIKWVINRLILIREPVNLMYLETDAEKAAMASSVALAISTAVGNPEIEPVLKHGVLAAWAFAESIADIKVLVNGGRLAPVKRADEWKTDIRNLPGTISGSGQKNESKGLSYSAYLQIIMMACSDKKMAYRAMDMMEGNCNVKMDEMITCAEFDYLFTETSIFGGMFGVGNIVPGVYRFNQKRTVLMP